LAGVVFAVVVGFAVVVVLAVGFAAGLVFAGAVFAAAGAVGCVAVVGVAVCATARPLRIPNVRRFEIDFNIVFPLFLPAHRVLSHHD